jgi:hypothetical protein
VVVEAVSAPSSGRVLRLLWKRSVVVSRSEEYARRQASTVVEEALRIAQEVKDREKRGSL